MTSYLALSSPYFIFYIFTFYVTHWRVIFVMYDSETGFILSWKGFNLMLLLIELNSCVSSAQQMSWHRDIVSVWKSSVFIQLNAYQLFFLNPRHRWNSLLGVTTLILLNMKPDTDESSLLFPLKENQSLETIRDSFHWEWEEWCWWRQGSPSWKSVLTGYCLINTLNIYCKYLFKKSQKPSQTK